MVRDIYGRTLKPGDQVVLLNIEALPFLIQEISGPIMTPMGGQLLPVHTVQIVAGIPIKVVGETGVIMKAFRVLSKEEAEAAEKKVQL